MNLQKTFKSKCNIGKRWEIVNNSIPKSTKKYKIYQKLRTHGSMIVVKQ